MNRYHFLVLGEEPRQKYLAELLEGKGHQVMVSDEYVPGYHDAVLLPVPKTAQYLEANAGKFQKGQILYGCNFPPEAVQEYDEREIRLVDYMEAEGVASRNAVATAEGAIAEALQAGSVSLHGSRALVAGYGRCGEVLAEKLVCMKAHVTVMERKSEKRCRAMAYGCDTAGFKEGQYLSGFDYVFNTVPAPVFGETFLAAMKKDAVIIDIASKPGGVDFEFCRKNGINAKLCPGLPGIYAPKSAAKILLEVIEKTILGGE